MKKDDKKYEPFILTIVDEFFQRVISNFLDWSDLIFIDSTGSLEQFNLPVFIFSIATPYGALPVGISICNDETEKTLKQAFEPLKKIFSPKYFMSDDCSSLKNALNSIWPNSKTLLCHWHFKQAIWTWLTSKNSTITENERQEVMLDISKAVESQNIDEARNILNAYLKKFHDRPKFCKKITSELNRISEWSSSFRSIYFNAWLKKYLNFFDIFISILRVLFKFYLHFLTKIETLF